MKKYIGVVRVQLEGICGVIPRIVSVFGDTREEVEQMISSYPDAPYVVLENNEALQNLFDVFEDCQSILNRTEKQCNNSEKRRSGHMGCQSNDSEDIAELIKGCYFDPGRKKEVLEKIQRLRNKYMV